MSAWSVLGPLEETFRSGSFGRGGLVRSEDQAVMPTQWTNARHLASDTIGVSAAASPNIVRGPL